MALAKYIGQNPDCKSVKTGIAIVLFGYGLGNSPSLINMAETLSKSGYSVDFYTCHTYLGNITFSDPCIQIYNIVNSEYSATSFQKWFLCAVSYLNKKLLHLLPLSVQIAHEERVLRDAVTAYVRSITSIACQTRYAYFIGVEPLGMMAACTLGSRFNTPFIYYNMELHSCPDIISASDWAQKNIERSFHGKALFTITQDEERARIMASENGVASDTFVTIPVCADGEPFREKTDFLRRLLNLRETDKIILYAGFIADWAMCEEIANSARSWPEDWIMVFHTHGYSQKRYMQQLMKYESEKIRFSLNPVKYEELSDFLSSADIGLAIYKNLGANFTLIGSASGKIAHYLKSGLPVIVNSYPEISNMVERYSCGVGVDGPDGIRDAIAKILGSYEIMREGAFNCYMENYQFPKYFEEVLTRIGQLGLGDSAVSQLLQNEI